MREAIICTFNSGPRLVQTQMVVKNVRLFNINLTTNTVNTAVQVDKDELTVNCSAVEVIAGSMYILYRRVKPEQLKTRNLLMHIIKPVPCTFMLYWSCYYAIMHWYV